MSEAELFTELVSLVEIDPFALLGISVSADEKRIAKRYRYVAKQLHPDALSGEAEALGLTPAIASQVIARIVNPSYQKLKHEKSRQETLSILRLRVRRLVRTEKLVPTFPDAKQLEKLEDEGVEVFYEQAMSQLASIQFRSLGDLHTHSLAIGQLNLIYLRRKMADLVIRPKRAGLITNAVTPTAAMHVSGDTATGPLSGPLTGPLSGLQGGPTPENPPEADYVAKHTRRAKTYLAQKNYESALQELRDALKIAPQNPEIHSMVGQVYYKKKMSGMAKAYFRQALKLKPDHKVAQKYGKLLGITAEELAKNAPEKSTDSPQTKRTNAEPKESDSAAEKTLKKRAWLGKLLNR
ncbi:MAG: tetratricopeptide repeat protein [Cyanobacteria bacterium J06598_1]